MSELDDEIKAIRHGDAESMVVFAEKSVSKIVDYMSNPDIGVDLDGMIKLMRFTILLRMKHHHGESVAREMDGIFCNRLMKSQWSDDGT